MADIIVVIIFTTILIFEYSKTGAQECETHLKFQLYPKEDVCLVASDSGIESFEDAMHRCEFFYEGQIVQVFDESKERALAGVPNLVENQYYWIGMHDDDGDGTFMHLNGTVVKSKTGGIGKLASVYRDEKCVVWASQRYPKWKYANCAQLHRVLCEKPKTKPLFINRPRACSLEECDCNKRAWFKYEPQGQYITVNKAKADFEMSVKQCGLLGAELLTIEEGRKHNFVRVQSKSWVPMGELYWLGLKNDGTWRWVNGQPVTYKHFWNIEKGDLADRLCSAAVWQYNGSWRKFPCGNKYYSLCQTKNIPCVVYYAVSRNDSKQINNGDTLELQIDHYERIECRVKKGYLHGIDKVTVLCADTHFNASGEREAGMTIVVDSDMHDAKCSCTVHMKRERDLKTVFTLVVKSNPRISREMDKNSKFFAHFGEPLITEIAIFANPKPEVKLTRSGGLSLPKLLNYTLESSSKPIYYVIRITILRFKKEDVGKYTLKAKNSIDGPLAYSFELKVKGQTSARGVADDGDSTTLLIIGLFLLFFALIALTWMVLIRKPGNNRQKADGEICEEEDQWDDNVIEDEQQAEAQVEEAKEDMIVEDEGTEGDEDGSLNVPES